MQRIESSYRDPSGFVTASKDNIFRFIDERAYKEFQEVNSSGFLSNLSKTKQLVNWENYDKDVLNLLKNCTFDLKKYKHILKSPKLDFISYPYEWCFLGLKKAALFHLEMQINALQQDIVLADATAYNIQFKGTNPIFIDHLSFKPYHKGSFWNAHGQFCEQFLNPLVLSSQVGIEHNALYLANMEGIPNNLLLKLLPFSSKLKPLIFLHIVAPSLLNSKRDIAKASTQATFDKNSYLALLKTLRLFIESLQPKTQKSFWSGYAQCNNYNDASFQEKEQFIINFVEKTKPKMLWDLGCNTGHFSMLAARKGVENVLAFDLDLACLNTLFEKAESENLPILPLYLNLQKPTPSIGWQQKERDGFIERKNADSLLALALIHHLRISSNIPLDQIVSYLTNLAPTGIIEFIPKSDSKVKELLLLREDIFDDYSQENFESLLSNETKIVQKQKLSDSDRILYHYIKN